jgi:bacterioferritin-associated ferredoxin
VLKQAVQDTGSVKPGPVYAACGCRFQCGKCVRTVIRMLREHASQTIQPKTGEQLQGAD